MNTEPAAAYSFERAFEEDAFLQLPLLSWEQFGRQAKERDVSLSFGSSLRDRLEDLDRTGALRPVAFVVPGAPGFDEYVFREGGEYRPWHEYPREDPRPQRVLYSHWQLLYVKDAVDLDVAHVPADWLLHEPRDMSEVFRKWHEMRLEQRAGFDVSWRSLLLLLTALQPPYYPVVRETLTKITTTITFDRDTGREVDPYRRAVETFDPEEAIRGCGLSLEDLPKPHENVAAAAHMRDPLQRFYMLARMLPHAERMKLKGAALSAQDGYDAAEMLAALVPGPYERTTSCAGRHVRRFGRRMEGAPVRA